jgi:hypothetical protein
LELVFPHRVEYDVPEAVAIEDVIGTLQANQRLAHELGELLNALFEGLTVEHASARVQSISIGSLREDFFFALFVTFQPELREDIPAAIESFLHADIPDHYNAIITIAVLTLLFYGGEFLYTKIENKAGSKELQEQLNYVIGELAIATQQSEARVRKELDRQFKKKGRLKELAKAAVRFFKPSRVQRNAPILVGDRRIDPQTISQIPYQIDVDSLEEGDRYEHFPGVRVQLHAKDRDKGETGWAGVVPTVSDERIKIKLYPDVRPDMLWDHETIWADVTVVYRTNKRGDEKPVLTYIERVLEGPDPKPLVDY